MLQSKDDHTRLLTNSRPYIVYVDFPQFHEHTLTVETHWFTAGAYLSVNDLRVVYKALYRVQVKWRAIGRCSVSASVWH